MKKLKRLLLQMILASLMMGFSVEGGDPPAGFDPPTDPPAGDPPPNTDPPAGDPPAGDPPAKTPEEIAAAATLEAQQAEAAKLVGAPAEYTAFTMPEGATAPEGMDAALATLGKKFNLSQEGGQELLNAFTKDIQPLLQADRQKAWLAVQEGWKAEAAADPEIGGAKYAENVEVAKRAIGTFMTPDIKQVLEEYGIGNHPGMIRMMYKIGTAIREDTFVPAGGDNTPESKLAGLYPTMKQ